MSRKLKVLLTVGAMIAVYLGYSARKEVKLTAEIPDTQNYREFPDLVGPQIEIPELLMAMLEHDLPLIVLCILGTIIAVYALWITVASMRNEIQSRNETNDEILQQILKEKEIVEEKFSKADCEVYSLTIMCRASRMLHDMVGTPQSKYGQYVCQFIDDMWGVFNAYVALTDQFDVMRTKILEVQSKRERNRDRERKTDGEREIDGEKKREAEKKKRQDILRGKAVEAEVKNLRRNISRY
jgi:hypothetical protein